MQKFNKKPVALAVGAALAAVAGGAMAASTQAVRTAAGVTAMQDAVAFPNASKKALFSASGLTDSTAGDIKLRLYVGSDSGGSGTIKFVVDTTANPSLPRVAAASDTANDIRVYAVDTAGVASSMAGLLDTLTVAANTAGSGLYTLDITFDNTKLTAGTNGFKIDSAGALQYTANGGTSWKAVKVRMVSDTTSPGGSGGFFVDDSTNSSGNDSAFSTNDSSTLLKSFDTTSVVAGSTLLPAPEVSTLDSDTNGLIDGVSINFVTPLSAALTAAQVKVKVRATDTNWQGDSGNSTADSVALTVVPGGTATVATLTFASTATTANWGKGDSVADAALYGAKYFNTGIGGATVPFEVDAAAANDTAATSAVYANVVFESSGTNARLLSISGADSAGTNAGTGRMPARTDYTDGAMPLVSSASYFAATKKLVINFSEPIRTLSGGAMSTNDVKEAAEYIGYGASWPGITLAAATFNADGDLLDSANTNAPFAGDGVTTSATNQGVLTLSKVPADVLNQKLLIHRRLSVNDGDDGNASTRDTTIDADAVGFRSASATNANEWLSTAGTIDIVPGTVTLKFDEESKAAGVMASDGKNLKQVDITYPYTISVDSTASLKDHFRLTVFDAANGASVTPDPITAFLDSTNVTVSGKVVSVAFPTNLILKNMNAVRIEYSSTWGDAKAALKFNDSASSTNGTVEGAVYAGGNADKDGVLDTNEINLPYYVTAGTAPLFTMETNVNLTNSTPNSKVTGYLAKWLDAKVADKLTDSNVKISGGKVTNPGDKVATDLSIEVDATAAAVDTALYGDTAAHQLLPWLIAQELNKATPAQIPVVIELMRSNDGVARGTGSSDSTGQATDQNWQMAHARISGSRGIKTGSGGAAGTGAGSKDALYDVMLDPKTGNISGRLTGQLRFTATAPSLAARGLMFINNSGDFTDVDTNAAQTTVATDGAGKASLMIGVDVKPAKQANLTGAFVLAVLHDVVNQNDPKLLTSADPGATNFLPFEANILVGKDGRKGLRGVDSTGAAIALDVNLIKPSIGGTGSNKDLPKSLVNSTSWQLVGVGQMDRKAPPAPKDFARMFVSLDRTAGAKFGAPRALWTGQGDSGTSDVAMTMLGGKTGVASEASTGDTVSTIALGANAPAGRFAFAFANDVAAANQRLFFLTKTTALTGNLPAGWTLMSANSAWKAGGLPSGVTHLLKVGAGYTTPVTWFTGDGASTNLVDADEPVFVFVKGTVAN